MAFYLVLELCKGGELFDKLFEGDGITERHVSGKFDSSNRASPIALSLALLLFSPFSFLFSVGVQF